MVREKRDNIDKGFEVEWENNFFASFKREVWRKLYNTRGSKGILVFTEKEFGLKEIGKTKIAFIPHFFI